MSRHNQQNMTSILETDRGEEWSDGEIQGMEQLCETLIHAPVSDKLNTYQVVSAYLQATCVAAKINFDEDFYKEMLLKLVEQSTKGN